MQKHVLLIIDDLAICKSIKYNLQNIYTSVYYAVNKKDGFKRYLGQVINKEQIYYQLWKEDINMGSNSVETLIMRLRKKLEQDTPNPIFIETVRGGGYRFKPETTKC